MLTMNHKEPKKYKSPLKAIREMCFQCMGGRESEGYLKRVSECGSAGCPNYEFRHGKNPGHTQNLTSEQRKERSDRLKRNVSHDARS